MDAVNIDELARTISNSQGEWTERREALASIRNFVEEVQKSGNQAESCEKLASSLEPVLQNQFPSLLLDRRSTLVKETCETLNLLSEVLRDRLQSTVVVLLPTLFKIFPNTIKVLSEAASFCVRTLLMNVSSNGRTLAQFFDGLKHSHPAVRSGCFFFIGLLVSQPFNKAMLEEENQKLEKSFVAGLSDAVESVRSNAKKAYFSWAEQFPERASRFKENLEPALQKRIQPNAPPTPPQSRVRGAIRSKPPSSGEVVIDATQQSVGSES